MRIMRKLGCLLVALVLFIGIEAQKGVFDTLSSVFSINTWANIPAENIWDFLMCLLAVIIILSIFEE